MGTFTLLFLSVVCSFGEKPLDSTIRWFVKLITGGGKKKQNHHWEENMQKRKQIIVGTVHGTLLKTEGDCHGLQEHWCPNITFWCNIWKEEGKEVGERTWQ